MRYAEKMRVVKQENDLMEVSSITLSRTIDTWIDIETSPDCIWEVLVDFSN